MEDRQMIIVYCVGGFFLLAVVFIFGAAWGGRRNLDMDDEIERLRTMVSMLGGNPNESAEDCTPRARSPPHQHRHP